ncbi:MAG TPA: cell division protein FtsL [Deltaproteobacteria bacterium]|nr:cell division protein FtsL [Deltaproteobacteria bacterium]
MAHAATGSHAPGVLGRQDVKTRRSIRNTDFLLITLVASFLLVAATCVYLWCRLMVVHIGYEITKGTQVATRLEETNRRLRLEMTRLKSPERIERIASGELGLAYPSGEQIIRVR